MILDFLVPSTTHPVGGVMAILEFANGMARRGHEVHVSHLEFVGARPSSPAELDWCELDPRLHHHFPECRPSTDAICGSVFDDRALPEADFVFCFDDRIPVGRGLPLMWVQAYGLLGSLEPRIFTAPCPKVCIARWLVDQLINYGIPAHQLVHIPYGLKHDKYRLTSPIEGRPRRVAMLYNSHPVKGALYGIEALAAVLDRVPDAEGVLFGTMPLVHALPARVTYHDCPDQELLIEGIYNASSVFISSSPMEGFGLAALEAMATGCALVTAANGGSADYAIDGETALVAPPQDAAAIASRVESLLLDDQLRTAIARRGLECAQGFDWDRSSRLLEELLAAYGDEPSQYAGE